MKELTIDVANEAFEALFAYITDDMFPESAIPDLFDIEVMEKPASGVLTEYVTYVRFRTIDEDPKWYAMAGGAAMAFSMVAKVDLMIKHVNREVKKAVMQMVRNGVICAPVDEDVPASGLSIQLIIHVTKPKIIAA